MVVVQRSRGDSPDAIWKKFGKLNYEENLMEELRNRRHYKKPSLKRKEEEKQRMKRRSAARRGVMPRRFGIQRGPSRGR